MDNKTIGVVGLIGGVLAITGIFTPWVEITGSISTSVSAWDMVIEKQIYELYASLALGGAIAIGLGALSRNKFLLALGGVLAISGSAWGYSDIPTGELLLIPVAVERGYGLYLTLVGGVLGLIGISGLKSRTI